MQKERSAKDKQAISDIINSSMSLSGGILGNELAIKRIRDFDMKKDKDELQKQIEKLEKAVKLAQEYFNRNPRFIPSTDYELKMCKAFKKVGYEIN